MVTNMKDKKMHIIYITSMLIFGTIGYFVRNVPLSSGEIALYRALLAAILIGMFLVVTKSKIDLKSVKKEILLLLFSGIAMGFNWIFLFEAYNYTTVSVATLSYYFAPIIVMIVCPFLFKEKLTKKQIICFVMSTIGMFLIVGVTGFSSSQDFIGVLFGLTAATLYATVILTNKYIKKVEGIHRTFFQFLAAILVLIPYVYLTSGFNFISLNSIGLVNLLIVGLIHTGITYCMYFTALKKLSGQEASILSYIDPLVAVIVSYTLLSEKITPLQIIGGLLILGFSILNEIKPKKRLNKELEN